MSFYVGQPVLSLMPPEDTYIQTRGPGVNKPVVRGIVTEVLDTLSSVMVWWEGVDSALYCKQTEVKDAG